MKSSIPFIYPDFPDPYLLADDLKAIVKSNHYTNFGPQEKKLSTEIVKYIDPATEGYCSLVSSATSGLFLAVNSLADKSKKYVIMPSFTFVAGAMAVIWNGFEPLFIDIYEDDLQPNIEQCEEVLKSNDKVAAILLCNTFGVGNTKINKWEKLAKKYNKPLIVDSAAGFGSLYEVDTKLGFRGDCEVFSFHATKPMGIGEGGAVTTRNREIFEQIEKTKNFGFDNNREASLVGLNAKLNEFSSAVGLRQLKNLPSQLKNRQEVYKIYKEHFKALKIKFQKNAEASTVAFMTCILPINLNPLQIIRRLESAGIQARNYYNPPVHKHPIMQKYKKNCQDLTVTDRVSKQILSLPSHKMIDESIVGKIKDIILDKNDKY